MILALETTVKHTCEGSGMLDEEIIPQQQQLLSIYRRNLQYLLIQAAQHGGVAFAPLVIANGLHEARRQIRHIKETLRAYGVTVDDLADDTADAPSPNAQAVVGRGQKPASRTKVKQIYQLRLPADSQQIGSALYAWHFLPIDQQLRIVDGSLEFGVLGLQLVANRLMLYPMANCRVECDIQIVEDGGDTSQWAGIRVRGLSEHLYTGHLIYLRSRGTVEVWTAGIVPQESVKRVVPSAKCTWVPIRVDILDSKLTISVNRRKVYTTTDKTFGERGFVYFHTHGTIARFRNIAVYEL